MGEPEVRPTEARGILDEAERLRQQARADRHASSVPLLIFGSLTAAGGLFGGLESGATYWLLIGPVGFLATWWWYHQQEIRTGVGQGRGSYFSIGLAALLAMLFLPLGFVAPIPAIGLGLLVMAIRQRNRYLGIWASVTGVIGLLETRDLISNRWTELTSTIGYEPGFVTGSGNAVVFLTGLLLVAAGLVALMRERTP